MAKMIGFLLASILEGGIWKEACKSLFYFFILFLILLYPSFKLGSYLEGSFMGEQFGSVAAEVVVVISGILISLLVSYSVILFFRDNYYYKIVGQTLEIGELGSGGALNQIKAFVRMVFILVVTIVGVFISFIAPIVGFLLMSFCFGLEIMTYVFDAEKVGLSQSCLFILRNFLAVMILGMFYFCFSLFPGLGLATYPASIRAGALYFKDLKEKE